ncbi:hypothetical protein AURDEDRAFT_163462 [Auricularia subglabra TFB-10046 SS5]|nr:hypothetical protein AURDEDRAFT_163462 [Auricularia subglabra TFB-10046 SS5]
MLARPRAAEYANLDIFTSIIDDAHTHGYHLGLSFYIDLADYSRNSGTPSSPGSPGEEAQLERNTAIFQETILPNLLRALPLTSVLNLYACVHSVPLLWEGLSCPAPILRKIDIKAGIYDNPDDPEIPPLPAHFLAGSAPRLAEVTILMVPISLSMPVLPSVSRLDVTSPIESPDLGVIFSRFPNIRDLDIRCIPAGSAVTSKECSLLDGLQSLRLGPHNVAELMRALPVSIRVPFVEYSGIPAYGALIILRVSGPLSVRIAEHLREGRDANDDDDEEPYSLSTDPKRFTQLRLEVASPTAVRCVDRDVSLRATLELLSMSGCAGNVANMTIDDRHVRPLIKACNVMPSLSRLCVVLVTWHGLARGAAPTEDEFTLYQEYHSRNDCNCLGGPFSDWLDGGPPDGCIRPGWTALETVELRAARRNSTVASDVLRGLADALTRAPERLLTLVLSNGLALAADARDPEIASRFAEIRRTDPHFYASLECVGRAAELIAAAARKKVEAWRTMSKMLRLNGPDFHREECRDAESDAASEERYHTGI